MYHRGEQYCISKNWNLYIFLQRNASIYIKISIIDICYTNMAPISKPLMFYLLHEWKIQLKCDSWKIYHHAGDSCPPNRYRSFKSATIILLRFLNKEQVELVLQLSCLCVCVFILFIDVSNLIYNSLYERMKSMETDFLTNGNNSKVINCDKSRTWSVTLHMKACYQLLFRYMKA